jgi:hypothetical protein
MRLYRFRIVQVGGEFVAQHEYECSNDTAAATKARSMCQDHNVEVWEGLRWVATLKDHSPSSTGPASRVLP